jgi:hypothetical protein
MRNNITALTIMLDRSIDRARNTLDKIDSAAKGKDYGVHGWAHLLRDESYDIAHLVDLLADAREEARR